MLWPDWEHYVDVLQQPATSTPAAHNTMFWLGDTPAPITRSSVVNISLELLQAKLAQMRDQHIVFVASAFQLTASPPEELAKQLTIATAPSCNFFVLDPKWPQT